MTERVTQSKKVERAFVCPGCGQTLVDPPTLPIKCECGCRIRAADWEGFDD